MEDYRLMSYQPPEVEAREEGGLSTATSVVESRAGVPVDFVLEQNHPNPFNSQTVLRFSLPRPSEVELAVYNLAGQRVAQLAGGHRQAGVHTVRWNGRTEAGGLASGVYAYRLRAEDRILSRKLLLLR